MAGLLFFCLALLSSPAPFSLLFAILLHEGAHIVTAAILGFKAPTLYLTAAGVRLSYCNTKRLFSSLFVLLSGCIAGGIASLLPFLPYYFRLYCAGLFAVNLLPISCLDGGGILLLALESVMLPDRAHKIARWASIFTVLFLWAVSTAVQLKAGANLTLLAISTYLTVNALGEGK